MRLEVWPSVPMYYIYPTDGPGALNPGWGSANKYKRRAESLFYNFVDRLTNAEGAPFWYPPTADGMSIKYPRPRGIRCDAKAIRTLAVGEDPRLIPFGTLPYGWDPMLGGETYENPGLSAGFVPDQPAKSKEMGELDPKDLRTELADRYL